MPRPNQLLKRMLKRKDNIDIQDLEDLSLEEAQTWIVALQDKYGSRAVITAKHDYDYSSYFINYASLETDEELLKRLDKQLKAKKSAEEREATKKLIELKELERLKAKYGV
jgi:hypothetical protein